MNSKIRIKFHDKDVRRYFEVHLVKKKQKKATGLYPMLNCSSTIILH